MERPGFAMKGALVRGKHAVRLLSGGLALALGVAVSATALAQTRDAGVDTRDAGVDARDAGANARDAGGDAPDTGARPDAGGAPVDATSRSAQPPAPKAPDDKPAVTGPVEVSVFSFDEERIWLGETLKLEVPRCADKRVHVHVERVQLRSDATCPAAGAAPEAGTKGVIDLTSSSIPAADGCSLSVRVGSATDIITRPVEFLAPRAALCVYYRPADAPAGAGAPAHSVQRIAVEIGDQRKGLLWAVLAFVSVVVGANVFLGRAPLRRYVARSAPERSVAKILYWLLRPATTPMGTYSLALAQVLIWSYVTLFAVVYVWSMSAGVVAISGDILKLLGIGSATAFFSRLASSTRTYVPQRYLTLIHDANRVPRLSDLLTADGSPNVFKLQVLVFTLVSAGIVVKEVVEKCAFPSLTGELTTLMGISSLTYVGSETLQRDSVRGDQGSRSPRSRTTRSKRASRSAPRRTCGSCRKIPRSGPSSTISASVSTRCTPTSRHRRSPPRSRRSTRRSRRRRDRSGSASASVRRWVLVCFVPALVLLMAAGR
ncbi:MAG: hypothetical protein QM820_39085 [Minicystis sp.]